jgi:hypothetical protein
MRDDGEAGDQAGRGFEWDSLGERVVRMTSMRETVRHEQPAHHHWLSQHWPKDTGMPLSEDEQRILAEIEKNLHESDPRLAKEVSETTVYRHALGSLKWSVLGFVLGIAVMVSTLQVHYLLAFCGFLLMLVSALGFERNLRMMGRAGLNQVSSAFRAANPNVGRQGGESADQADD